MRVRRWSADQTWKSIRVPMTLRASWNYQLSSFFGKSFTAEQIQVVSDNTFDIDSVRVFDAGLPEGEWERSVTVRGNWHFLEADTHRITFAADRALSFQDTFELILDQILLESEFHLGIPSDAVTRPELPTSATLSPPYPNPFNATSRLRFTLNVPADVKLEVFNLLGQHVQTMVDEHMVAGEYEREFSCPDCASGLYLARLSLPHTMITQKMLLLK